MSGHEAGVTLAQLLDFVREARELVSATTLEQIDCLEGGYSIDQFLSDFPSVSRQQVLTFLEETKAELEPSD